MTRLFLRIDLQPRGRIGPGKVTLLEAIASAGSISGAGRALGMSYRRAWLLVDELNRLFRQPVVTTQLGGSQGGGASLTPFGKELVASFRRLERDAAALAERHLAPVEAMLATPADRKPEG
jgi:molybdate transport system regulatory protein